MSFYSDPKYHSPNSSIVRDILGQDKGKTVLPDHPPNAESADKHLERLRLWTLTKSLVDSRTVL
jgi:hypothetical protein